jgi:uncharacterized membrane protein
LFISFGCDEGDIMMHGRRAGSFFGVSPTLCAAAAMVFVTALAQAQPKCPPRYRAQVLTGPQCPGGGMAITIGTAINELGQAAGRYTCVGPYYPWVWTSGPSVTPIGLPPGATDGYPGGINEVIGPDGLGQVVMSGPVLSVLGFRGFIYHNGQWTMLDALPDADQAFASAINNAGVTVGTSHNTVTTGTIKAVRWMLGSSTPEELPIPTPKSWASSINESGAITGWMGISTTTDALAFVLDGDKLIDLGPVPGGYTSEGKDINSLNEVVGSGYIGNPPVPNSPSVAFHWKDGKMTVLPNLPGTALGASAHGINDHGLIIGNCDFTWTIWVDGEPHALYPLVVNHQEFYGFQPNSLNNAGQIIGDGAKISTGDVGVILNPLPPVVGDVDCDRKVNVNDLLGVIHGWGRCPPSGCAPDLNGDGTVNQLDLVIVIENWS